MTICGVHFCALLLKILQMFERVRSMMVLDGTQSSFVKFPALPVCSNTSVSFDFLTGAPSGLLFYSGGLAGRNSFMELKLIRGLVCFRFNCGAGTRTLCAGEQTNDNKWHSVNIVRTILETKLIVDAVIPGYTLQGVSQYQPNSHTDSSVYVGGVPSVFIRQLETLALPSVVFEQPIRGSVRGVTYSSSCDGWKSVSAQVVDSNGVRTNTDDSCSDHNPCQNNGDCLSTDVGPHCECSRTDFNGTLCQTSTNI